MKEAGVAYVPRLEGQSEEEYRGYVGRALFFNATGRTAEGFSGMVFRRDPVVKLPKPLPGGPVNAAGNVKESGLA